MITQPLWLHFTTGFSEKLNVSNKVFTRKTELAGMRRTTAWSWILNFLFIYYFSYLFLLLCGLTQQIILGWFWPSMVLGESLPEASGLRILMRSDPLFGNPKNFAPHNFTRFPYPAICRSLDCFQVWSFITKRKLASPQNFQATGCKNIALH